MTTTPTPDHTIIVNDDGTFSPQWLWIRDGETVEWQFHARTDTIIPAEWAGKFPAICSAYKPYDPSDPNEFTGPMPRAASGIFTLGPDGPGQRIKLNPTSAATGSAPTPAPSAPAVPLPGSTGTSPTGGVIPIAPLDPIPVGTQQEYDAAGTKVGSLYLYPEGLPYATMDWTWKNPNITGAFVRLRWSDVDQGPHMGVDRYDWSDLDREIEKAVANGKLYSLAFKAGEWGTPQWLFDDTVTAPEDLVPELDFGHTDDNGDPVYLGSPADPNYRRHYFDLLEAAAAHIKEKNAWYRALAYVKLSGANTHSHENRLFDRNDSDWQVWAEDGDYTPKALYEFFSLQSAVLASAFPDKDMSYALISSGFPNVNDAGEYGGQPDAVYPSMEGTEQTEHILEQGRMEHGLRFAVQHNGLGPQPQYERVLYSTDDAALVTAHIADLNAGVIPADMDVVIQDQGFIFTSPSVAAGASGTEWRLDDQGTHRVTVRHDTVAGTLSAYTLPEAACPNEGVHPAQGPFANPLSSCPNRWALESGEAGQVTGFQTQHSGKTVRTPQDLESTFQNAWDSSDGVFLEIYEQRFWEAEQQAGGILDPNASNRTIAQWADEFHARRRGESGEYADPPPWTQLPDPLPMTHRHTFRRTLTSDSEVQHLHYIHGSKCGQGGVVNYGVIAILPNAEDGSSETESE